jgi:hypothetical protein
MAMRKFIAAISFLCYFVVTTGFTVNMHYCMDRLASVHLFETAAKTCGICGMETHDSDGCCRDEVMVVKLVQDQQNTLVADFNFNTPVSAPAIVSSFLFTALTNEKPQRHFQNHSPPLLSAQDTYLQNSVFRI